MSENLEFSAIDFDIPRLIDEMREHSHHSYPAEIDDFCRFLLPRCVIISSDKLLVEIDVTLLSNGATKLQKLVDMLDDYILRPMKVDLMVTGKRVKFEFSGKP